MQNMYFQYNNNVKICFKFLNNVSRKLIMKKEE